MHKIQDRFGLIPLSHWGGSAPPVAVATDSGVNPVIPPLDQVNGMLAGEFFHYGLGLLDLHPPHVTEWSFIAQMRRLGVARPGGSGPAGCCSYS